MADLPTNYMDDILAESMNGKRKYRITRADGSFEEVTLEDISEYEQIGSVFGAGDINRINQAVNEKFDSGDVVDPMETTVQGFAADALAVKNQFNEQNKNMGGLRFGVDSNGNAGYIKAGADSVIPFKSGVSVFHGLIGGTGSTDTKTYTFDRDSDNVYVVYGHGVYYGISINGTKITLSANGATFQNYGLFVSSPISVKKGDVISISASTTSKYEYYVFY